MNEDSFLLVDKYKNIVLRSNHSITESFYYDNNSEAHIAYRKKDKKINVYNNYNALSENLYSDNIINLDNFSEVENINTNINEETISNKTIEDILYENLLKKYLSNRNGEELIQIRNFYDKVDGKTYEGNWMIKTDKEINKFVGSEAALGKMDLTFKKYNEFDRFITQSTAFRLRLLKGDFIDDWIQFQGFSLTFTNFTLKENTLIASYSSYMEYGQLFEKKGNVNYCDAVLTLNWNDTKLTNGNENKQYLNADKTLTNGNQITYLNGTFKSNCEIDIKFELFFIDDINASKKILNYSIIFTVFCILQLYNNLYLMKKINDSNAYSSGVTILLLITKIF